MIKKAIKVPRRFPELDTFSFASFTFQLSQITNPSTGNIKSKYSLAKVKELGWQPVDPLQTQYPVYPLKMQGEQGTEFWLGLNNFRSITRYNHSVRYAMTVFFLHESIKYAL